MDYSSLRSYMHSQESTLLSTLQSLVEHESPSDDKLHLDALARLLAERFAACGAQVEVLVQQTAGNHVRAYFPGPAVRPALLLCHFDTVWPVGTLAARPFRVEGGQAWGPGILDMKAGIVVTEFAMRAVAHVGLALPRPVVVLLTADEEVGSGTSRARIEEEARGAEYVLVLEPPLAGGVLKTARKGVGGFTVEVEGRAAHSGAEPEKGISAVHELAQQILDLGHLADPAQGTTINVGVVQGGTRPNVVAAQARAEVDVRVWNAAEAARVQAAMFGLQPHLPGARLHVEGEFDRPPMERSPQIAALFERVRAIGRELGLELQEGSTGGGSDGNFTAALGRPTLDGLGVDGAGGHAVDERIQVASLPERAALLAAILAGM